MKLKNIKGFYIVYLMLGKEHIDSTLSFELVALIFIIFSYLSTATVFLHFNLFQVLFSVVKLYYIPLILFAIGMTISATVPDIDISGDIKGLKIWNKLLRFDYTFTAGFLSLFFGQKVFSHRHIYHSFFGAISYAIYISLLTVFVSFILLLAYSIIFVHVPFSILGIITIFKTAISLVISYKIYLLWFIFGAILGFLAHLFEDSLTVSGVNYFIGFTEKRLAGKFITVGKNGYRNKDDQIVTVPYYRRSAFGANLVIIFNILFAALYFYFGLYLFTLIQVLGIYFIFLFLFSIIFCGLKIKKK